MKKLLEKYDLNELTQDDLDEIRLYISACTNLETDKKLKELIKRYNKVFDMLQRYIDDSA